MRAERRKVRNYQRLLFEQEQESLSHDQNGNSGTESGLIEEQQTHTASEQKRALAFNLMERIVDRQNLNCAYKRVKANKGSPGIDGMTIKQTRDFLAENKDQLIAELLEGRYQPQEVRGVEIPKPNGGMRLLGIPTVKDRIVQQAILQILEPIFDPSFSDSSFGFRPYRGAHKALHKASKYVGEGRGIVVDLDLEKFFDRVNHDILMSRLARKIGDKRLLRIIRRFLEAGLFLNGICQQRVKGTPQGGPLSPLLSNILLDDLDKELERRGHCFVRYADDCNIYVRSLKAGERVLASITRFLKKNLKLKVNQEKSAVAPTTERKFLGYRLYRSGDLGLAPESVRRAKGKIRELTRRNRGVSFGKVVKELSTYLKGWIAYFHLAQCKGTLQSLDRWIRRKLRCYRLKQRKRAWGIARFLIKRGVPEWRAWLVALSRKGWWRRAGSPQAAEAMPIHWFKELGLINLEERYLALRN